VLDEGGLDAEGLVVVEIKVLLSQPILLEEVD
jgi:hypothetical protein